MLLLVYNVGSRSVNDPVFTILRGEMTNQLLLLHS